MTNFRLKFRRLMNGAVLASAVFMALTLFSTSVTLANKAGGDKSDGGKTVVIVDSSRLHLYKRDMLQKWWQGSTFELKTSDGLMGHNLTRSLLYAYTEKPDLVEWLLKKMSRLKGRSERLALLERERRKSAVALSLLNSRIQELDGERSGSIFFAQFALLFAGIDKNTFVPNFKNPQERKQIMELYNKTYPLKVYGSFLEKWISMESRRR